MSARLGSEISLLEMLLSITRRTLLTHLRVSSRRHLRCISTITVDPAVRDLTSNLVQRYPAFSISPNNITILSKPREFYTLLVDMVRRAESRIFISSLYIGSGEIELVNALTEELSKKPALQLHLHLDLNRSTRPGASSTAKLLLPLIHAYPKRVHVSLFRSPSLRGILAKLVPPRFNEGWGTWHAKIYGVDDEVMISGANLNESYFNNRQDRYIHFTSQPRLAQYCFDFLQTISTFSYKLLPSTPISSTHSYQQEDYTLQWPDPDTHPHHIHQKAEAAISAFQTSRRQSESAESDGVVIFPIIQAGQFNVREEETALWLLFHHLNSQSSQKPPKTKKPLVDLTSGYFGLYEPYQDLILASDVKTRIVAASPKANGFFGSRGISGRIPEGYTLLEQKFMRAVKLAGRKWHPSTKQNDTTGVHLSEWEKPGWTYHAKGIWVSPNSSSPPVLTLFGSTNLNSRSAHIDTELSFIMVIPSEQQELLNNEPSNDQVEPGPVESSPALLLRHKLAAEISNLRAHAVDWQGGRRKVRFWTKVIVRIVKGML
ncbi:hypothetical protein BDZ94DRAFT_1257747 [Collybia nuda]|uniref:CDP-diacylglycerol--glycerol-3-phosphate 3-phosphatidyltransferase n=1 Tax=Collybia nuda TaxID=64659 RepID=A0A9P6CKJ3_9AGAR|nr:hypothetical protein BDZ94DRAFT_1257747 [Collybia nuda]